MTPCFRRDGQSLERFLDEYFIGRLKRYVKSEPVPERNTAAVKVRLRPFRSVQDLKQGPNLDL